jgi:hypothetical protein
MQTSHDLVDGGASLFPSLANGLVVMHSMHFLMFLLSLHCLALKETRQSSLEQAVHVFIFVIQSENL